jgi:hypothetical protein
MLAALSDSANTVIIPPRLVLVVPLKGLGVEERDQRSLKLNAAGPDYELFF